ncbi:MAG: RDD family protein [Candidatus Nanopelagicales bacterium]
MAMEPGWYPDPFGGGGYVRWWDGERWGQSAVAPSGVTTDPGAPVLLPPPLPAPGTDPTAAWPLTSGEGVSLAAWGQRAVAWIIDWAIVSLISAPFVLWALWPSFRRFLDSIPSDATTVPPAVVQTLTDDIIAASLTLSVITLVITFVYQVPQNVLFGRTVGKRILGIRIRMLAADRNPGWFAATVRWGTYMALNLISGVLVLVDCLWPLWDKPWRQALHDKTARTIVVRSRV